MWFLTVLGLITSSRPISTLSRPPASSLSTCSSRRESVARMEAASSGFGVVARTRRAFGRHGRETAASPAAASSIPRTDLER